MHPAIINCYNMSTFPLTGRHHQHNDAIVLMHQSSSSLDSEHSTVDVTTAKYCNQEGTLTATPCRRVRFREQTVYNKYHEDHHHHHHGHQLDEQERRELCWYNEQDYERFQQESCLDLQQILLNEALLLAALQLTRSYEHANNTMPSSLDIQLLGLERRLNFQSIQTLRQDLYNQVLDCRQHLAADAQDEDKHLHQVSCEMTLQSRRFAHHLALQWQRSLT